MSDIRINNLHSRGIGEVEGTWSLFSREGDSESAFTTTADVVGAMLFDLKF